MRNDAPRPQEPPRYVHLRRVRCPACGSGDYQTTGTKRLGGDSVMRYTRCRRCGWRFVVTVD